MNPRNLEPVPPGTRFHSPELGNVWYTRPYSFPRQWLEWTMGWRSRGRATEREIIAYPWFSTGFASADADLLANQPESHADADPFTRPEPERVAFLKGELEVVSFLDNSPRDSGFLPACLREKTDLDLTVQRREGESEEDLILRSAQELADHTPPEAADCVRAYEKILRSLLTLIRE